MNNFEIRLAVESDLNIVNSFLRKMEQKDIDLEKLVNHPYDRYYIYKLDGIDVGFLSISVIVDRMELNYVYVNPLYRGKHIASDLMDYMIKKASIANLDNISLEVSVENKVAIELYKKYEFDTQAIREKYYNDSVDALLMVRWLKK